MRKLCLCLALMSLLGLGGQAFAVIGTIDDVPAATLLLPYFEVDIADAATASTRCSRSTTPRRPPSWRTSRSGPTSRFRSSTSTCT